MKKAAVVMLLLAALLAGGLWTLQRTVTRRLARLLPDASRAAGIPLQASELGFSLWRGAGGVKDLRIGNPPGYAESNLLTLAEGRISVRYLPLFRRRLTFNEVTIRDADLTVVRTSDGRLNVKRPKRAGGGVEAESDTGTGPSAEPGATTGTVQRGSLPLVAIDHLQGTLCVRFVNHAPQKSAEASETALTLQVTAVGLSTFGDVSDEASWGTVSVEGSLEARDHAAPIHLVARIAPLLDPKAPTFKLNGTITGLDPESIQSLMGGKNSGIKGEAERVEVDLVCERGRFDESRSKLTVTLKNVKMGSQTTPSLTLTIPVHGTLEKPKLRLEQALFGALAQLLAAPPAEAATGAQGGKKRHKSAELKDAVSKGLEALLKAK